MFLLAVIFLQANIKTYLCGHNQKMTGMGKYIYELTMKVRDYECDLQGIVNNANYQQGSPQFIPPSSQAYQIYANSGPQPPIPGQPMYSAMSWASSSTGQVSDNDASGMSQRIEKLENENQILRNTVSSLSHQVYIFYGKLLQMEKQISAMMMPQQAYQQQYQQQMQQGYQDNAGDDEYEEEEDESAVGLHL